MIVAEIFADKELKKAALEFSMAYKINSEEYNPISGCIENTMREPYGDELKILRNAFIAGAVYAQELEKLKSQNS